MKEIWQDIKGYEGKYQISNLGRVKSVQRFIERKVFNKAISKVFLKEAFLRPWVDKDGYCIVNLYSTDTHRTKHYRVHRLVAESFIKHEKNKLFVNHKNGNKQDNRAENLEWATNEENIWHSTFVLKKKRKKGRQVKQFDTNDKFVKVHESLSSAGDSVGVTAQAIWIAIKNNKKCGGYIWRYAK